jgi:hypothetical protein
MIWREKRIPLLILGVFLLANAVFFFTYRVQYESRLRDLDARKHDAEQRLAQVRGQRTNAERQLAAYRKAQVELASIYNEHWATEPERLTALIDEVKRLETASQLIGRSHAFSKSEKDASSETGVGTNVVIIAFTVQGSYQQIRRLINLLELSDQFVIIDSISLSGSGEVAPPGEGEGPPPPPRAVVGAPSNGPLTLNLRLKTIFRAQPAPVKTDQQL